MLLAWCAPAAADVRHCVLPDGQSVFTDRGCAEVGGTEQVEQRPVVGNVEKKRAPGCARNLDDLLFEMNTAFAAHDANRLAGVYHWTGMSGSTAYNVMERLDAIVQRPLIDIVPVMPEDQPTTDVETAAPRPVFTEAVLADVAAPETPAAPAPPRPRSPVAVRVEQTLENGITPSRTVFGLQKHFGCWWIKG
ncbi:hypothetical protein [Lysobacter auxotrophicus]|uniref:DUF4124 domain-containing protein n=1 Tax=Lysobacter auxotrophicus TaxID=2992573 RepID=A0ABM8DGU9_9GAMM|nr:hypothetical protein [Lysobacter auxotrophicus]BDU17800.1 DUF4124 domain-containing protein [Lysobacter auxotrophicus]